MRISLLQTLISFSKRIRSVFVYEAGLSSIVTFTKKSLSRITYSAPILSSVTLRIRRLISVSAVSPLFSSTVTIKVKGTQTYDLGVYLSTNIQFTHATII